jgi:hypothetical protein
MLRRRPLKLASVVGVATLSLFAAGCGGGGSPGVASIASSNVPRAAGSSAATSQAHALLLAGRCLREHGIPNFPDPIIASAGPAKGQAILDKQFLRAVPSSVLNNAMVACRAALAQAGVGSGSNAGARTPQEIQDGLAFARCVRNHGISNFPDPNGQGGFNLAGTGINSHELSAAELAAARTCLPAAHGAVHIPPQGTTTSNSGQ